MTLAAPPMIFAFANTDVLSVDGQNTGPFTCTEGGEINMQIAIDFVSGASSQ